jgi:hypothetical protein
MIKDIGRFAGAFRSPLRDCGQPVFGRQMGKENKIDEYR